MVGHGWIHLNVKIGLMWHVTEKGFYALSLYCTYIQVDANLCDDRVNQLCNLNVM